MGIRERETLALLAALTDFQVEIPKLWLIRAIKTYPLEMNLLTTGVQGPLHYPRFPQCRRTASPGTERVTLMLKVTPPRVQHALPLCFCRQVHF